MSAVKLKPSRPELKVYNPATGLHLKNEGDFIVLNKYWRRLLKAGDVEIEKAEEPKPAPKKASSRNNNQETEE